ncbi:hypothetical protein [Nocardia lasii]|uniref:hypothetical protein n=1 Tax=Nocardia lasii TaxID=1616107 RepID=UPI00366C3DD2
MRIRRLPRLGLCLTVRDVMLTGVKDRHVRCPAGDFVSTGDPCHFLSIWFPCKRKWSTMAKHRRVSADDAPESMRDQIIRLRRLLLDAELEKDVLRERLEGEF